MFIKFKDFLLEMDLSIHTSRNGEVKDFTKYGGGTDSIYRMSGRGTGHFGSGTYFSTYKYENPELYKEIENLKIDKPFIKLEDGIFVADLDKYNLYKPSGKDQAELLFKTLKKVNQFFYNYSYSEKLNDFNKKILYELSEDLKVLNLKIPNNFLKIVKEIADKFRNDEKSLKATISTLLMEYNGWNGVNVNHIRDFDNTMHGSVIYDLEKTIDVPHETKKFDLFYRNNWSDIIRKAEKGLFLLDFKNWNNAKINSLLKQIDTIIDIKDLDYMIKNDKLTPEQKNHILNVYYKIAIDKLKNNDLKIPFDTLLYLLENGWNGNFKTLDDIYGNIYSIRNNKQIVLKYLNSLDYDKLDDVDKELFDDIKKELDFE